jgi:hypothetical protein
MYKKKGRPPKAIKQKERINFVVTNVQYFIIRQKVTEARVNISDYMRQMAVYGYVKPRWTQEEREMFKKLIGISNDINQLVVLARQEGMLSTMLHFTKYRDLIDEIINQHFHAKQSI